MSIHEKQKSCKLFKRIKAGIISAVMFTGSVMTNYAGLIENSTMFAAGEETAGISESSETFSLAEKYPELDFDITLKSNGQWKVTFKQKTGTYITEIPANVMNASEFDDYRDNIDEVMISDIFTKIAAHAFESVKSLNIISGGVNVKEIGEAAFKDCTYLTQCWIVGLSPDGVLHSSLQTIGKEAFSNSGLTEVSLPSGLTTIGERAFYECQSLKKVDFQENCQVNNFGLEAFGNCKALESVNLENCTANEITFNHNDWKGVFSNCDSLKKVIVPAGASGDIANIFREALSLESITFMENDNPISGIGNIIQGTSVKVLDLSPLKGLTTLGAWQVRADSVTKVIFPSTMKNVDVQAVGDMPALTIAEFEPNSVITSIGSQMFQNDKALVSVNLEALLNLQEISVQAFENCENLTSVIFPKTLTTIKSNAFNNCKGLIDVKYNAESLTNIEDNIFNNVGYFDLTIGENVKTIDARFLSQAQEHISGLKFDGTPTFTITEGADLKEPFTAGGTYSVDVNGNLYKIEGDGAKLVYVNKTAGEITIPEKVGDYTVTGIAKNAFKNSNVTNLTFQKPENITSIEDYAFANAMLLESINGESIDSKIKELFSGAAESTGNNLFYNTKIKNESGTEIKEDIFPNKATPESHDNAIVIDRLNNEGSSYVALNYTVDNDEAEIKDDDTRKGKFWTGETAVVKFAYNGGRPVRIYIRADENAVINFNNSDNPPTPTGIDGIYYYDVVYEGEKTGTDSLNLSYPNFSPPGSKMQVWAVEFDNIDIYNSEFKDKDTIIYPGSGDEPNKYKISDKYFELEWTTKPLNFDLKKIYATNAHTNFIKSSDGQITLSNLKYRITFTKENVEEVDRNVGNDIVRYVDYTDILTLPSKLKWRDEINMNYTKTHFIKNGDSGTLYINLNGNDYELFTLSNVPNLVDMSIKPNGDKTYSLCWRLANTSTTAEISVFDGYITFGSEVIVAEGVTAGENIGDIINNISANEYFTFSQMQEDASSDLTENFTAPESKLIFKKELLNTVSRMGEDVQYKITVENPSAFAYTGMSKITDNLNADGRGIHYIKPENMQLLFNDTENGDKLTITINNAVLANKLTEDKDVTVINNEKDINIFEQNTANNADSKTSYNGLGSESDVAYRNVTITLSKNSEGNIEIHYKNVATAENPATIDRTITTGAGKTIADALSEIGYIVTASDSYYLEWDYPTDYSFDGGKTMEFFLNTSLKNSLMYLPEKDDPFWYGYSGDIEIQAWNQAELTGSSETLYDKTDDSIQKVHRDLEIRKGAFLNGEEVNETYQLEENDILDYYVRAIHYGSGSYTVLPIVDHMVGRQAVIVDFEKNKDATWTNEATPVEIDGVKYYVLNKDYIYRGVYTSEYFYADSIKVTKTDEGLDTLIKYYIENTPEKDFNFDVTYKAINSQEFAGNEKTKTNYRLFNEAWLNDRPGHRIYDTLGLSGSAVEFDKKILIGGMKDNPQDETLETKLPIKQSENKVTYRLMLHSTSPVTKGDDDKITAIGSEIELSGRDIFDMLPLTGTAFDWSKENISNITYKAGENGYKQESDGKFTQTAPGEFFYNDKKLEGESTENEWEFTKTIPSTVVKPDESTKDDQQYIKWDEKFKIKLPPQATVYMYVTLTFPGNDEDAKWDKFLEEKGTDTLVNTFYLNDIPAPVSHTLADPPKAFLKKGVYETGSYVTYSDAHYRTDQYYIGKDRFHYSNTYEGSRLKNTVTYYVVLSNTGNTNLYLAPLYDILPPGFSYMALRTGDGSNPSSNNHVGNNEDYWSFSSLSTDDHKGIIAKPKDGYNDDFSMSDPNYGNYVRTKVNYCYGRDEIHKTANGCQILKFEFENDSIFNGLSYDSDKNAYYLKPGQFLQFGYTVYTGDNPITEAENKIVMQYYDPNNTGVSPEVSKNTEVAVKNIHDTAPNNDGDCDLWETEKVREAGFNDSNVEIIGDNKSPKWFESDVKVTREKISPGIKKTVESPMIQAGGEAKWKVTSFNNSNSEISGYTITDTLDLPLQFSGKFTYSLYDSEKNWYIRAGDSYQDSSNNYLFEMKRSDNGSITITSNNNDSKTLNLNQEETLSVKTVCYSNWTNYQYDTNITVKLEKNADHEVLTIGFADARWSIVPNGYSELNFSTLSLDGKDSAGNDLTPAGQYVNTAMFSPEDKNYDDNITQGKLVEDDDGNNLGVEHTAVVSIYTGSPSGSVKMIEQKGKTDNFTTSERDDNYIKLPDKKTPFTYTLEVRNVATDEMKNLVIIDNLPEQGDATTLRKESMRESEFKVNLAKDAAGKIEPNIEVWLYNSGALEVDGVDRDKSPVGYTSKGTKLNAGTGRDYTVEYSDITSKKENKDSFIEKDWQGENENNRWYDTPKETTRSIRIHFSRQIKAGEVIQIRFDAVIDPKDTNAQPGKIAWNTFGYSYKVNNLTAKASPNKVGICIPGSPTLTKKVVDSNGKPSKVPDETTFKFIIYKSNNPLKFDDYTEKTVAKTLNDAKIDFMYKELTVDAGEFESKAIPLDKFVKYDYKGDENFSKFDEPKDKTGDFWDENSNYYVVELDTNDKFSYQSTNGNTTNNYRFKVDPIRNTPLEFVNENLQAPVELPETGGKGTGMFVFGGLMMICLSAFFLLRNKRKHTQK